MEIEKFSSKSVIFVEGEKANDLLIVKKGVVRIVKEKKGDILQIIGVRKDEEFLGEHSLFFGSGFRSLTAVCEKDVEIVRVAYGDMKKVISSCPGWVNVLMETLISRSKSLHNMLIEHHIDDEIIQLLSKRKDFTKKISKTKKELNSPIYDKKREQQIIDRLKTISKEKGLDENFVVSLYEIILKNSKDEQEK